MTLTQFRGLTREARYPDAMCNRYEPTRRERIPQPFRNLPFYGGDYLPSIGPRQAGPFALRDRIVAGQWGQIPWFSREQIQKDGNGRLIPAEAFIVLPLCPQ